MGVRMYVGRMSRTAETLKEKQLTLDQVRVGFECMNSLYLLQ